MPQMGVSVAEGTIVEWRKRPGDWVEADETICDVTTDKVDVEIPSPAAGVLGEILVEAGETVDGRHAARRDRRRAPAPARPHRRRTPAERRSRTATASSTARAFYSPVVRRIADEHGIDLEHGRGPRGRRAGAQGATCSRCIESGDRPERPERPLHSESPYRPEPAAGRRPTTSPVRPRREPLTPDAAGDRRAHGRQPQHGRALHDDRRGRLRAAVAARRAELRERWAARASARPTSPSSRGRRSRRSSEFPVLNASIDGDEIVHHDDVNLGIAVALDDGLIVPVIHAGAAAQPRGHGGRDRRPRRRGRASGRLEPDDVHGGTFTITNPGQFGAVLATPIINQPQVAILDLEAVVKRPVVVEGDGGDAIAIRPMAYLCMSWDHRALDGAEAARFLGRSRAPGAGGSDDASAVHRASAVEYEEVVVRARRAQRRSTMAVAVHSTALGPALGGARLWHYAATGDAVADALRLARGDDLRRPRPGSTSAAARA